MDNIQFPYGRWNSAHELIEESLRTHTQIKDLLGLGLPADYTQEQILEAYRRGEWSEGYIAHRLNISRVELRRLVAE